jgi:hypothetical protein
MKNYIQLTQQAKSFRQALLTVSKATSALASALEDCSRVKGCDTASDGLMALSGLKYMMGAHQQLMVSTEASAEPVHQSLTSSFNFRPGRYVLSRVRDTSFGEARRLSSCSDGK